MIKMTDDVQIEINKEVIELETYPYRVTKGNRELWFDSDGDLIATEDNTITDDRGDYEEEILNLSRDFDDIWNFIMMMKKPDYYTRDEDDIE